MLRIKYSAKHHVIIKSMLSTRPTALVVLILDGWGISFVETGNAIMAAQTPTMDHFAHYYPAASLQAASIEVGLPWGEVGNSETGHKNIGAGTVQYQILPRIDHAIEDKSFFENSALLGAVEHAKEYKSDIHLMGLLSPGGVHSHMNHLFALLELMARKGRRERVFIHIFTDGRDTLPKSALPYIDMLEQAIGRYGVGAIASVTGRFYAMDRNKNWDRTRDTFDMLTGGPRQEGAASAMAAVQGAYDQGLGDEKILPTAITKGGGPLATVKDNDAVIFFNYRPDRARQLTAAFVQPDFDGFSRRSYLQNLYFVTMSQYDANLPVQAAYIENQVEMPLARVISDQGLKQLHVAETEKYAHVTYYLNGGREDPFPGEERKMIPSSPSRDFSLEPEMSAAGITDVVEKALKQGKHDIYFVNYANVDMVGHTGDFQAAMKACEFVDLCVRRLYELIMQTDGALLVTADHGNAEEMLNPQSGEVETDHTSNPVPLYYVRQRLSRNEPKSNKEIAAIMGQPIGVLSDVAPTVLEILQLPQPVQMSGVSLLSSLK